MKKILSFLVSAAMIFGIAGIVPNDYYKELYIHANAEIDGYGVTKQEKDDIILLWNCQEMCSRRIPKILERQESGGMMSRLD